MSGFRRRSTLCPLLPRSCLKSRRYAVIIRVCAAPTALIFLPLLVAPHDPCPCVASAHPVPCTQTALPCRRAFSPVNVGRCLCGTPSSIPHASSRRPVTRASRRRACIRSCEDKFTQRTPRYLRHYRCPSRNATFRSQNINTRRPMAYPRATSFWSQATQ